MGFVGDTETHENGIACQDRVHANFLPMGQNIFLNLKVFKSVIKSPQIMGGSSLKAHVCKNRAENFVATGNNMTYTFFEKRKKPKPAIFLFFNFDKAELRM